ncbi:MAG TPA: hypothetical protein VFP43_00785 [Mesorhizobium sp.]|nr:hypothetical protein [Mesorhizobium sp.]
MAKQICNLVRVKFKKPKIEMTPLRAAFLSFAMLTAITIWGVAIYTADAATDHAVVDGYGVSAQVR